MMLSEKELSFISRTKDQRQGMLISTVKTAGPVAVAAVQRLYGFFRRLLMKEDEFAKLSFNPILENREFDVLKQLPSLERKDYAEAVIHNRASWMSMLWGGAEALALDDRLRQMSYKSAAEPVVAPQPVAPLSDKKPSVRYTSELMEEWIRQGLVTAPGAATFGTMRLAGSPRSDKTTSCTILVPGTPLYVILQVTYSRNQFVAEGSFIGEYGKSPIPQLWAQYIGARVESNYQPYHTMQERISTLASVHSLLVNELSSTWLDEAEPCVEFCDPPRTAKLD